MYYSNGLQKGLVTKTSFIMVGPDFNGDLPKIPNSIVVHCTTNQSWLIVRTQIEGLHDLDNVHAVQDQYDLRPLSAYGKPFTQPAGTVDPSIPVTPGPSPQANALNEKKFFTEAAKWFNKVPFPDEDKAEGGGHGQNPCAVRHCSWAALRLRRSFSRKEGGNGYRDKGGAKRF